MAGRKKKSPDPPQLSPYQKALAAHVEVADMASRAEDIVKVFEAGGIPLDRTTLNALRLVEGYISKGLPLGILGL